MSDSRTDTPLATWLVRAGSTVAGVAAAVFGYRFGDQVSGWLLGLVAAANAGLIGALLGGEAVRRLLPRRSSDAPRQH